MMVRVFGPGAPAQTGGEMRRPTILHVVLIGIIVTGTWSAVTARPVEANHSLGFHWPRTANPFTVPLGNNLTTGQWSSLLADVSAVWSQSSVLDVAVVPGQGCQAHAG